ncbi:MAG: PKD domain-containing protein, partial [Planctomycetes bacterium]|nr:PKD domain-containing protein [Planctomycetota bacterium]
YFWDFGDGQAAEGEKIAHLYNSQSPYEVMLITTDNSGQVDNAALKTETIHLNQPPIADAGLDIIGAPGQKIPFDGTASIDQDGKITNYFWDFDDGNTSTKTNLINRFKEAGRYRVTLRVEDNSKSPCNYDIDTLSVWINAQPIVELGENRIGAIDEVIIFDGEDVYDDDGRILSYVWDLGDSTKKIGKVVRHTYNQAGQYIVQLTVEDDAGAKNSIISDNILMIINDPPVPMAGDDRHVAAGETVVFDGSKSYDRDGEIIAYGWNFGDNTEAEGAKVSHAFSQPGEYTVILNIEDDSSSWSSSRADELTVFVNFPPVADAGRDQLVTPGEVWFDAGNSSDKDGQIIDYHWDFGDDSQGSGLAPRHIYGNPGTYQVNLTVTDDSGTTSSKASHGITVVVNRKPIADAGPDQIGAPGQLINFDGSKSFDPDGQLKSLIWNFGDGETGS